MAFPGPPRFGKAHHDLATCLVVERSRTDDGHVRCIARSCLAALLVTVPVVLAGSGAMASCMADSGPADSDLIFVGTAEENRRGYTRFAVSEVLAGPVLAPDVWVRSGQEQPPWPLSLFSGVSSSGDADFSVGHRYVVGATDEFVTNTCQSEEFQGERQLQPLRTPSAGPANPAGLDGADPPIGPLGIGLVTSAGLGTLLALGVVLRRRRSAHQ